MCIPTQTINIKSKAVPFAEVTTLPSPPPPSEAQNAGQQVAVVTEVSMVAPKFFKNLCTSDQYYFTSRHWYVEKTAAASTFSTIQEQYTVYSIQLRVSVYLNYRKELLE